MTRKFSLVSSLLLVVVLVAGCGKKQEDMSPVQPGETVTYKDLVFRFSMKAPKAWVAESVPGKNTFYYSTAATETRFQKFTEGDYGARIGVGVVEHSTKEDAAATFKQSMDNVNYGNPEPTTLGGQPAIKVTYSINDPDGLNGYRIFSDKDSLVTFFDAASFGAERVKKYSPVFDMAEKSVQPAFVLSMKNGKVDSAAMTQMMESMKPSDNMSTFNGTGFSIQYPDNFNATPISGGVQIMGERQDAMVKVDQQSVDKGVDLTKYVDENAKKYHSSPQSTTLGGQPAKMLSYGSTGATARAYFVMQGQKAYRITVSWPNQMEASFRPALEKSVQSFRLK